VCRRVGIYVADEIQMKNLTARGATTGGSSNPCCAIPAYVKPGRTRGGSGGKGVGEMFTG